MVQGVNKKGIKGCNTFKLSSKIAITASKVFLAGMKLPMNYGKKYRTDFEKTYSKLVKDNKVGWIPFLLEGVGGEKALNLADGIHPNEKGHKKVAQNLFKLLVREL